MACRLRSTLGLEKAPKVSSPTRKAFSELSARVTELAARYKLPAIYPYAAFAADSGGLMAYEVIDPDLHRGAATYVAKILKGARPSDLPIQQPTKFRLVINLKTAETLGLTIPHMLLARADEVIE